jgi:hypothetical protein
MAAVTIYRFARSRSVQYVQTVEASSVSGPPATEGIYPSGQDPTLISFDNAIFDIASLAE